MVALRKWLAAVDPVSVALIGETQFSQCGKLGRQENEEARTEHAGFPNQVVAGRGTAPTSIGVSARPRR